MADRPEWQYLDIPLGGGLQEDKHAHLLSAPRLSIADNVTYQKGGAIQKRHSLAFQFASGASSPMLGTLDGNLVVVDDDGVDVFPPGGSAHTSISFGTYASPVPISSDRKTAGKAGVLWPCFCTNGVNSVFVWSELSPNIVTGSGTDVLTYYRVESVEGVEKTATTELLDIAGTSGVRLLTPMAVKAGQYAIIVGREQSTLNLLVYVFDMNSPGAPTRTLAFSGDVKCFDLTSDPTATSFWIVMHEGDTYGGPNVWGNTRGIRGDLTGATPSFSTVTLGAPGGTVGYVGDHGVCCQYDSTGSKIWIGTCTAQPATAEVRTYTTDLSWGTKSATLTVASLPTGLYSYSPTLGDQGMTAPTQTSWGHTGSVYFRGTFIPRYGGGFTIAYSSPAILTGIITGSQPDTCSSVQWQPLTSSNTLAGSAGYAHSVHIAAKGWLEGTRQYLPLVTHLVHEVTSGMGSAIIYSASGFRTGILGTFESDGSLVPAGYFLSDAATSMRARRDLDSEGGPFAATSHALNISRHPTSPPTQWYQDGDNYVFAARSFDRQLQGITDTSGAVGGSSATGSTLAVITAKISGDDSGSLANIDKELFIANSGLLRFDGSELLEAAVPFIPQKADLTATSTSTWNFGADNVFSLQYRFWFLDTQGRRRYSSMSEVTSHTAVNGALGTDGWSVFFPKPPPSVLGHADKLFLEVWASYIYTTTGPSEVHYSSSMYRYTSLEPAVLTNGNLAGFVWALPSDPETTITWPVGAELQPEPVHATSRVDATGHRVWSVSADQPSRIYFSKDVSVSGEFEWNLNLYVDTPDKEAATAVVAMDDQLVVFTEDHVYVLRGTLPNNAGSGANFSLTRVETDGGCANPNSIIPTHLGVFFQGPQGIKLLTRGLEVLFLGANVETQTAGQDIVGTALYAEHNEVIFATALQLIVFNYKHNAWSTWTNPSLGYDISDVHVWNGEIVVAVTNGDIYITDVDVYTDVVLAVRTPWIKVAGLQGYKRVREILILGSSSTLWDSGSIVVSIQYDYATSSSESHTYAITDVEGDPMQIRLKPDRQKFQSFRLTITEIPPSGQQPPPFDTALVISGLSIEWARKQLGNKMARTSST